MSDIVRFGSNSVYRKVSGSGCLNGLVTTLSSTRYSASFRTSGNYTNLGFYLSGTRRSP